MKTVLQKAIQAAVMLSLVVVPLLTFTTPVGAQSAQSEICNGLGQTGGSCGGSGTPINHAIAAAINILSLVGGVAAVIMLIIGGLRFITSSGDSSNVASARSTIIYALVGLIIVALAQFIVHFVLAKVK
jgi:hypothetical protein